jgi:hypothetical protein
MTTTAPVDWTQPFAGDVHTGASGSCGEPAEVDDETCGGRDA